MAFWTCIDTQIVVVMRRFLDDGRLAVLLFAPRGDGILVALQPLLACSRAYYRLWDA